MGHLNGQSRFEVVGEKMGIVLRGSVVIWSRDIKTTLLITILVSDRHIKNIFLPCVEGSSSTLDPR